MSLIENKRVGFDYAILETLEAGLELFGFEVKSLRAGNGSLKGAHVVARGARRTLSELQSPLGNQLTHRNRTTRREPDGFCFREKNRALPPQNPKRD